MKLVVFGATGGTGSELVRQALAAGHQVTAVARRPEAVAEVHPQLEVFAGDVLQAPSLEGVMAGADAVLSALGAQTGQAPTKIYSEGMTNLRRAMEAAGVRRVLAVSAVPVSRPEEKNFVERHVVHPILWRFFGGGYADPRTMEAELKAAPEVDWTVLRPPRLLDGPATGQHRMAIGARLARAWRIRRADLAAAMLGLVGDTATYNQVVTVAQ